ncbi:MAG: cupredoxin family copper-binding protein [Pseudomonadota bacterium]
MTHLSRRQFLATATLGAAAFGIAGAASADGHANHVVEIKGFAFAPGDLTIQAGDKVAFVNADRAPHTATADNGSFDTGRLGQGQEAVLTFTQPGVYTYFCAVHPAMKATITVTG